MPRSPPPPVLRRRRQLSRQSFHILRLLPHDCASSWTLGQHDPVTVVVGGHSLGQELPHEAATEGGSAVLGVGVDASVDGGEKVVPDLLGESGCPARLPELGKDQRLLNHLRGVDPVAPHPPLQELCLVLLGLSL